MNGVSLFAGVGGFERAFQAAGVPFVASVEKDRAARGVLADRFPDTTLFEDVREVTGGDLIATGFDPRTGVLTAGWPCQGNSVAGRRQGMDDARSGLWWEVVRLLDETRPRWFVGENVPGLLSVNGGRDMGAVLWSLGELGYGYAWRILDAQHFGVPQRRRRVIVVGCLGDRGVPVQVLLEPESRGRDSASRPEARQDVAGTLGSQPEGSGWRGDPDRMTFVATTVTARHRKGPDSDATTTLVTHALTAEGADASEDGTGRGTPLVPMAFNWQTGGDMRLGYGEKPTALQREQVPAVQTAAAVRRLTPVECERLQGFPDGWTATSWGKPQPDSARYRQLGNAVAVPVIEWVARRLILTAEAVAA